MGKSGTGGGRGGWGGFDGAGGAAMGGKGIGSTGFLTANSFSSQFFACVSNSPILVSGNFISPILNAASDFKASSES